MLCDVCKQKKATVFLTQIVKGEMQKVNLCESCSKEKGVTDPTGFALADMLLGFGHGEKIETQPQERTCPACGMPQTTFRKTGRLGCAKCYTVFGEGMDNLLKAMHKGTRHTGKVPARAGPQATGPRLEELKAALDEAVKCEQFEEAARIRDEILRLSQTV
ncbi:MAG TPA: UvrB/UvrC motif-containing protein [Verrucomicrobiales bacterium]|jgi:protein arginine kinase activator|nr:UvrB/UvrC motif-containing protein [Verrucomicrobiales bacterium]